MHSRFGPNRSHGAYARSLDATFVPVDFLLPWEGRSSSPVRRYASWLLCAAFFPDRRSFDVVITDGPQFPPVLMRRLRLLRKRQRLVAILGDDTLYRLTTGAYSRRTAAALTRALKTYDALLCVGQMGSDLARQVVGDDGPAVFTIYPVVGRPVTTHSQEGPDLDSANLVVVAHGPSATRARAKGLDLALEAFDRARRSRPDLSLTVVGEWDRAYVDQLSSAADFVGPRTDLAPVFGAASLCLQLARGEAFGMSVMEAMAAGVPCLVSEWTGAKELVSQVDDRLVVPLDLDAAAERLAWYVDLTPAEKRRLSGMSRQVVSAYSDERALAGFKEAIATVAGR